MRIDHPLNPHIYRRRRQTMESEQHHTVRNLYAHAREGEECFQQCVVVHGIQLVQVAAKAHHGCCVDVLCPVAYAAGSQLVHRAGSNRLRGGEGIPAAHILAAQCTEPLYARADGGDAFALRNDKGDQHLPGILPENPQSCAGLCRCTKEAVCFGNAVNRAGIIVRDIEICRPARLKGLLGAGKRYGGIFLHCDYEALTARAERPFGIAGVQHAENLTGIGNIIRGKMRKLQ